MSPRHAAVRPQPRRFSLVLVVATVLGLWFGVRAPDVSPVAPPDPAMQVQPADDVIPTAVVPPVDPRGDRRRGRPVQSRASAGLLPDGRGRVLPAPLRTERLPV